MSRDGVEFNVHTARVTIHPAPTRDEAAAIVAALRALERQSHGAPEHTQSAWRLTARREGLRTDLTVVAGGWRLAERLER